MSIMLKFVKKIIVLFEGCIVRLKEIETRYSNKEGEQPTNDSHEQPTKACDDGVTQKSAPSSSSEDFLNISIFDYYVEQMGLPLGSNFVNIIKRLEIATEYNLIESLLNNIGDIDRLVAIIDGMGNFEFVSVSPSPLRSNETNVVDKRLILDEMSELGIIYDDGVSLFDNCIRVLQARQKRIVEAFNDRFNNIFVSIKTLDDKDAIPRRVDVLKNELFNRKQILEIKLKRY